MERAAMSTFDDPFDANRKLPRSGCSCGRHRCQDEHEQVERESEAQRQLRGAASESGDTRYQGVVASAVLNKWPLSSK